MRILCASGGILKKARPLLDSSGGFPMQAFELSQLLNESERTGEAQYSEFLRHPSLSMGVYSLAAGALDPQQPHTEDEGYYVASGQRSVRVGDETALVKAGS